MRRDDIDFHAVADHHLAIHEALLNWSRWVRVRPHGWQVSPMFRLYRPEAGDSWWERRDPRPFINIPEAVGLEKAVSLLPEKHRDAIRWYYVHPSDPLRMSRRLGVSKQGLADLVMLARTMLTNRSSDGRKKDAAGLASTAEPC